MAFKLLVLVVLIKTVAAKISLDLNIDNGNGVQASINGIETNLITEKDIKAFNLENYTMHLLREVKRTLTIKSMRVKRSTKHPVIVMAQNFENPSNHTITTNAAISHSVANTLTTKWSKEVEFEVSEDIDYELNLYVASVGGTISFSFTNTWGVEEEISRTETIGTSSGLEVELKPGDAVRAVLSAYAGVLEVEVVHKLSLTGPVYASDGYPWNMPVDAVMRMEGIKNEVTTIETIKFNYYVESSLKVYEMKTGLLLL